MLVAILILPPLIKTFLFPGTFVPKTTFLELLTAGDLSAHFAQQTINVNWCLFPSVPVKITSAYIRINNNQNRAVKKYFEVEDHTECKYGWPNSPKDLDGARERYISAVKITDQEFWSNRRRVDRIRCHSGPYKFQQWLGLNYTVPWVEIMRCPTPHTECIITHNTIIAVQREKIYNGGNETIMIDNSTKCKHKMLL
ncbi:Hypothetical predicted protein [Paramuricea clavata]|uniref:Uncharacterized protein n=1 Tax=Paramuricea clavata TaxID=317549 RepID=A0A6S7FUK8_PARCT|nr:Hypothetical predicted protein [Paramuricea clavata]